jgi:L-ribulose-5-phosphate 3-epimerase
MVMKLSRRSFLAGAGGALAATPLLRRSCALAADSGLRLGACDWSLRVSGPEALAVAKEIGLDGVEVSAGSAADVLHLAKPEVQAAYQTAVQETGMLVPSVAMGLLNEHPFATDPRGPAWLEQTLGAAEALEAQVILLAFFGKGDLREGTTLKAGDIDVVVERIRAAAPLAEKAGVILGLENTLSARDNLAILERIQSEAVLVYYDICNSTNNGYDVPDEIRMLGDRICQIHLKENGVLLGEGKVDMLGVQQAVEAIGYKGWLVLETPIIDDDMKGSFIRNAEYTRVLFKM